MVERPGQPNIGLLKSSSVDCLERDIKNSGYRKEDLAAPSIPELTASNEIDLDKLGANDLRTTIQYDGMKKDDRLRVRWLGRGTTGKAFDYVGNFYIEDKDLPDGLEVSIQNQYLVDAAGGEVFYSYTFQPGSSEEAESLRRFCYIGLRPRLGETLSVLQLVQSHGLIIQPDKLPGAGLTAMVPRYQAMREGDKVTLRVVGYESDGTEDQTWTRQVTVGKTHFDKQAISEVIGRGFFDWIDPGYVLASYTIDFVDGGQLESPVQRLTVDSDATLPGYLDKPSIDGYTEGDPLDPSKHPDGLVVKVPEYPGIADSDYIVMLWSIPGGGRQWLPSLRVDPSTRASDSIVFQVDQEILVESQSSKVSVSFLYGRQGAALHSQVLEVNVQRARLPDAPTVAKATSDGAANRGLILAGESTAGVYVDVPAAEVQEGEVPHVHWWGRTPFGQYIAQEPASPANPLRFWIPPEYVPANMGKGEKDFTERFDVFYRLTRGDDYVQSQPYKLRIKPLATSTYPSVRCEGFDDGGVSLAAVPEKGLGLMLDTWTFVAAGQLLTIEMSGVDKASQPVTVIVRDAKAVTVDEANNGIKELLAKDHLRKLKIDDRFTLSARVSFNGGEHFFQFIPYSLPLRN